MRIALAGCILAAGCAGGGGREFRHVTDTTAPAAIVTVEGIYYWTDTVRVASGSVVRWVNRDVVDHTVSFEGKRDSRLSGKLKAKGTYAVRFDTPGVYRYYCDPHPTMRAVVIVR